MHEKTGRLHFLVLEKYHLKLLAANMSLTIFALQHPGNSRDVILLPFAFTGTNLSL